MKLDLEAELRDLCARRGIHEAICNYMRGQDRLMPELHRSAFHDDAYVDCGVYAGDADGFVRFAQGFLGSMTLSHHMMGQAQIEVDGYKASGEVYFIAFHRLTENGRDKDLFVAGRYVDEYEDRGSGWKIARRRLLVDWARTEDAADAFVKQQANLVLGARGNQDFSNQRNWPP
jgi:SnoaL-like protein